MIDLFVIVIYRGNVVPLFISRASTESRRGGQIYVPGGPRDRRDAWDAWVSEALASVPGDAVEDGIWILSSDAANNFALRWVATEDWAHILVSDRPVSTSESASDRTWHRCPGRHDPAWLMRAIVQAIP